MDRLVRCISWVAVSSEEQARDNLISLPNQRKGNREFIDSIPTRYPGNRGILIDELQVTDSRNILLLEDAVKAYPAYAKLREMIDTKAFDLLVAHKWDRIGRTEALVIVIRDLCLQNGIAVVVREAIPVSIDASVLRHDEGYRVSGIVGAWSSAREGREIGRRSKEGRTNAARKGAIYLGKWPYGYHWEYDSVGQRAVVVDRLKADVVQRIFDWYLNCGYGRERIAELLNQANIQSPNGGYYWHAKVVTDIIGRADFYAGTITINRRGDQDEVSFIGQHDPIIDKETALRVLQEVKRRKNGRQPVHAIPSSCKCGYCGKNMVAAVTTKKSGTKRVYEYARCKACRNFVTVDDIVDALTQAIQVVIDIGADDMIIADDDNRELDNALAKVKEKQDLIAQEGKAIDRLLDGLESGLTSPDRIRSRLKAKQASIDRLTQEIAELTEWISEQKEPDTQTDRIEAIKNAGFEMIEMRYKDPVSVKNWLRRHFAITVTDKIEIFVR